MHMRTLFLPVLALAAIITASCASAVGPTTGQSKTGQSLANSPLNAANLTDGSGAGSVTSAGPVDITRQHPDYTEAVTGGQVLRTVSYRDPSGRLLTIRAGTDLNAKGVKVLSPDGSTLVQIDEFGTSASVPLAALAEQARVYQETFRAMSADQRAVIQSANEAYVKAVEAVSPVLGAALRALLAAP